MLIKCVVEFKDLEARRMRKAGETWEATPERLAAINRAGYGVLAEAVEGTHEAPKRSKSVSAVPTAEELEGMTNRQLVELCIKNDVETDGRPKKAELLSLLKAHFGLE